MLRELLQKGVEAQRLFTLKKYRFVSMHHSCSCMLPIRILEAVHVFETVHHRWTPLRIQTTEQGVTERPDFVFNFNLNLDVLVYDCLADAIRGPLCCMAQPFQARL